MAKVMKALHTTFGLPGPPENYVQKTADSRQTSSSGGASQRYGGDSLTCRVCQRSYTPDADGKRLPRDLNCGHVFCQRCLTDCMSRTGNKTFVTCPSCKKKTTLVGSSILELPVNRELLAMVRSNPSRHRHHNHHGHRHAGSSEGRQVRLDDERNSDQRPSRQAGQSSGSYERSSRSQERSRSQGHDERHGKSCSCQHDKVSEKQVVVKSALKKLRITEGPGDQDHTAIVKAPARLHPPPKGSSYSASRPAGDDGSALSIGSCNDLDHGEGSITGRDLGTFVEEEIEVISNDVAPVVRSKYPLEELHELAPRSFVEDLNAANPSTNRVMAQGHVSDDHITSLTDMLHMQPTTASYISSFGRYSEVRGMAGDFCGPTRISCSRENKVLVVDRDLDNIQAFSRTGDSLANFVVREVTGACFLDESTLAVSSPRGVELYRLSGRLLLTIPLGLTVAVVRHPDGGFVAAQPTRVSIGQDPTTTVRLHSITSVKPSGQLKRHFIDVTDVAVTRSGLIAVLDDQAVIVTDQEGACHALINPASPLPQQDDLFKPFSLAIDPLSGQIVVSDSENRCISAFSAQDGGMVRCLVNFRDQVDNDDVRPNGIAINGVGQLFIVLRAPGLAEVAIYNI